MELTTCWLGEPSPEEVAALKAKVRSVAEWWRDVIERVPEALGSDLEDVRASVDLGKSDG
jgi:hypothetical protein